ncbi:PilW family protein [Paracidovorax wautersii]|uniref:PilW family protein n=1 Tax=Paracidovorax wautersii TaxID=1177982 RepID=UPI0031D55716
MPIPSSIRLSRQRGVTLIELMVGIAIGLLVVAVAVVSLMNSRTISGTVSESTLLQQQAGYALRIIGQQVRQAGSIELNLTPSLLPANGADPAMAPVAFDPPDPTGVRPQFDRSLNTIAGTTTPGSSFTVGYENYAETTTNASSLSQLRDCLGQNPVSGGVLANPLLTSKFERKAATNELVCTGRGSNTAQPIIGNVTDFRLRYVRQDAQTNTLQYLSDTSSIDWKNVYAVEVCLELTGTEQNPTADATYTNCSGVQANYGNRLRMVFRNLFQIRSQGLS